jgi:hypothetical protein
MQPQAKEPRLKKHTIYFMIAVALFYDGISVFLPTITSPVAALHFWVWFKLHGIKFTRPSQIIPGIAAFALEFFPLSSWFTGWTAAVAYLAFKYKETGGEVVGGIEPKSADNKDQLDKAA